MTKSYENLGIIISSLCADHIVSQDFITYSNQYFDNHFDIYLARNLKYIVNTTVINLQRYLNEVVIVSKAFA